MANIDQILQRYSNQLDNLLLGGNRLESYIRRNQISDELAAGIPSAAVAIPDFISGVDISGGAPSSSGEALSDIMTFISHLPSGIPGQQRPPVNWSDIYRDRARTNLAKQELLDAREIAQSQAINESIQRSNQIEAGLAGTAAQGISEEGKVLAEQQASIERFLSGLMTTQSKETQTELDRQFKVNKLLEETSATIEAAKIRAKGNLPEGVKEVEFQNIEIPGTDKYIIAQGYDDPNTPEKDFIAQKAIGQPQDKFSAEIELVEAKERVKQKQKLIYEMIPDLQKKAELSVNRIELVDRAEDAINSGAWTAVGSSFITQIGGFLADFPILNRIVKEHFPELTEIILQTGRFKAANLALAIEQLAAFGGNDSQMEFLKALQLHGEGTSRESALAVLRAARNMYLEDWRESTTRLQQLSTEPEKALFQTRVLPVRPKTYKGPNIFELTE